MQVVGARAVVRATGPDRYGGPRSSAQPPTVVEVGCPDQAGARVLCSGRDTRHAGAADRLGSAPGARKAPATRHPNRPGWGRRPSGGAPSAAPSPHSGEHREDVLRGSASSLPRAVPPVHRPHRRRRRRRRQPEGRRRQDDVGGLAGRGVRRAGQAGPAGRPRRPGLPHLQPRRRPRRGGDQRSTRCCWARRASPTAVIACEDGVDLAAERDRPGRRRGAAAAPPGPRVRPAHRPGRAARTTYDVVLLDCSPSLGVLTLNALTAGARAWSSRCRARCSATAGSASCSTPSPTSSASSTRDLEVLGILPTMFDGRSNHAQAVLADVGQRYGLPVLAPPIPKTVRFAEAPGRRALDPDDLAHAPRAPRPTGTSPPRCSTGSDGPRERREGPRAVAPRGPSVVVGGGAARRAPAQLWASPLVLPPRVRRRLRAAARLVAVGLARLGRALGHGRGRRTGRVGGRTVAVAAARAAGAGPAR